MSFVLYNIIKLVKLLQINKMLNAIKVMIRILFNIFRTLPIQTAKEMTSAKIITIP